MSSVQARTLSLNYGNAPTYLTSSSSYVDIQATSSSGTQYIWILTGNHSAIISLNQAAKEYLYPNTIAHPTRIVGRYLTRQERSQSASYVDFYINSLRVSHLSGLGSSGKTGEWDSSAEEVISSTVNSDLYFEANCSQVLFSNNVRTENASITAYFTRYDFSATVGSGVTSASVSSSNGYDGDTVTFTASVQNGYTWDGWYNGTTKVSSSQTYVHTVSGADLSLTAKAIASTKQLTVTYGGNTIIDKQVTPPVGITYDNTQIASVASGQTKTLNCSNKLMSSNVIIGAGGVLSSALGKLWRRISWWLSVNPKGGGLM